MNTIQDKIPRKRHRESSNGVPSLTSPTCEPIESKSVDDVVTEGCLDGTKGAPTAAKKKSFMTQDTDTSSSGCKLRRKNVQKCGKKSKKNDYTNNVTTTAAQTESESSMLKSAIKVVNARFRKELQTILNLKKPPRKHHPSLPPFIPACDAALRSVTIYFTLVQKRLSGFTFAYDDETEVEVGNMDATTSKTLELEPGEHIIGWKLRRRFNGICFRTTQNRYLTASMKSDEEDGESDDEDYQDEKCVENGYILRSARLVPENDYHSRTNNTIFTLLPETIALNSIARECPPSLFTLASYAYDKARRLQAEAVEEAAKEEILHIIRIMIRKSSDKKSRLKDYFRAMLSPPNSEKDQVLKDPTIAQEVDIKIDEWVKSRLDIFQQQLAQLEFGAILRDCNNNNDNQAQERWFLCASPHCRKMFLAARLPAWKRCSRKNCTSLWENCGCGIVPCPVCHRRLFCAQHLPAHLFSCRQSMNQKCGFHPRINYLLPGYCQKIILRSIEDDEASEDDGEVCHRCFMNCCESCSFHLECCGKKCCRRCYEDDWEDHPICEDCIDDYNNDSGSE